MSCTRPVVLLSALVWPLAAHGQAPESGAAWYCTSDARAGVTVKQIDTRQGPQKVVEVRASTDDDAPSTLVVFLHGDSPSRDPVYQYAIARDVAGFRDDIVAVTLLRPGYGDDCGDRSAGDAGDRMGDNYTADVVSALATVLRNEILAWAPRRTVVIGHSGGAALGALLAATEPGLLDRLVLVACPCDLEAWRRSMATLTGNARWLEDMAGLSPIDFVGRLDPTIAIDVWVGDADIVTPPFLGKTYADKAMGAGKNVTYRAVEGGDHDMFLNADTLNAILGSVLDRTSNR